ncbi:MAG: bifunctional hydroxymethylpyrimidine kinase/phosphomethylpyrimidine kinase [Thermodesulfobacteriota bacterium]
MPTALTIAGSDSGGGAGIQADLKTFTSHRVFGLSVLTSITAQNTLGVHGIYNLPPEFIELQFDSVANDIGFDAVKLGMLSNIEIAEAVSKKIKERSVKNLVIDPVMKAKDGSSLLKDTAVDIYKELLFDKAKIVTPNIPEAEILISMKIENPSDMKKAAEKIKEFGCDAVLIKGGHLSETFPAIDIFFDGRQFVEISSERIKTKNTHGTGCTYSAAICANLAKGMDLLSSVKSAKEYLTNAIQNSFKIGKGNGPINHFWNIDE